MAEVNEVLERNVDPIGAMMTRAKQELAAIDQQITASRTTLRALEDTLKTTQAQIVDAQAKASALQQAARDMDAKAAKILADAKTQAGVILAKSRKEAAELLDPAKARVAAATRLLASGDTAGAA